MQVRLDSFTKCFDGVPAIEDMNLTVEDGEMLALLGPSGCGKSTTLFSICGIYRADGGRILFGGRDVGALPSQKRNVGVVFQNYALYPHLTVFDNIAFPLKIRHMEKKEIAREVEAIAALTHIGEFMSRRPAQLSGGQQQRVALARALVRKPDVLLLDEPLANLDAKLRLEMRSEIRRIQKEMGITAILVTHDQVEAMSMCDRIAIMDRGRIVQVETPTGMYEAPASRFVAGFLGNPPVVFVEGETDGAGHLVVRCGTRIPLPARLDGRTRGESLCVGIRPEHFGTGRGWTMEGRIGFIEPQGRETLFDVEIAPNLTLRSIQRARDDVRLGDRVSWMLDHERLLFFDAAGRAL